MTQPNVRIEDVEKMEAGSELDRLVAEHIMQWTRGPDPSPMMEGAECWLDNKGKPIIWMPGGFAKGNVMEFLVTPPFSTDIATAWQVVEKLQKACSSFQISIYDDSCRVDLNEFTAMWIIANAATAPLAICRAALSFTCQKGG